VHFQREALLDCVKWLAEESAKQWLAEQERADAPKLNHKQGDKDEEQVS
jgi:hypothetical protein